MSYKKNVIKNKRFFFSELIFFQIIFRRGFNYIGRFYTNLFARVRVLSPPATASAAEARRLMLSPKCLLYTHRRVRSTRVRRQVCRYVRRLPLRKDRLDRCVTFIILMTGTCPPLAEREIICFIIFFYIFTLKRQRKYLRPSPPPPPTARRNHT